MGHSDPAHRIFALDSASPVRHTRLTSQSAQQPVPVEPMFACSPCSGMANLLTLLISTKI